MTPNATYGGFKMKRFKLGNKQSQRMFTSTSSRHHKKNFGNNPNPMRGGIRL